jgi:hypothetical protein
MPPTPGVYSKSPTPVPDAMGAPAHGPTGHQVWACPTAPPADSAPTAGNAPPCASVHAATSCCPPSVRFARRVEESPPG